MAACESQFGEIEDTLNKALALLINCQDAYRLADERTKLLHAHYAGAVPLDLLKSEQERIAKETSQAAVSRASRVC